MRRKQQPRRPRRKRLLLLEETARIMIEDGVRDLATARRKAARRLGIAGRADWPDDSEIEAACARRLSMFSPDFRSIEDEKLDCAEAGLELLSDFSPRLTGQLARGPALAGSVIEIHVFAHTLEDVLSLLELKQLRGKLGDRPYYYRRGKKTDIPVIQLRIDAHDAEISVFALDDIRKKPLSPGHQRPMQRLSLSQLRTRRAIRNQF